MDTWPGLIFLMILAVFLIFIILPAKRKKKTRIVHNYEAVLMDNPRTVTEIVCNIVAEQMGADVHRLLQEPRTSLEIDLGADSLDIQEIFMEFEDRFDVTISDEDIERCSPLTIGRLVDLCRERGAKDKDK
jgi:acyl carrier protein